LIAGEHEVNLKTEIRAKTVPKRVKQRNNDSVHKMEQIVDRMERIRSQLEFEDWSGNFFNKKLWLVVECLEQQIEDSFKSIGDNFLLMEMVGAIVVDPGNFTIQKSENDLGLIEILRSNKMARRIFGYRNMERLIRQFQVSYNGWRRTVRVQPQHLGWFW